MCVCVCVCVCVLFSLFFTQQGCRSLRKAEVPARGAAGPGLGSTPSAPVLLQAFLTWPRRHKVAAGALRFQGCGFPCKQGQGGQRGF